MKKTGLSILVLTFGAIIISCGLITEDPTPETIEIAASTPEGSPKPMIQASPTKHTVLASPTTQPANGLSEKISGIPDTPLSDEGPWWVFSTPDGLYAVNPDGSGLTQFFYGHVSSRQSHPIQPSHRGGYLAFLEGEGGDAILRIAKFPGASLTAEIALFPNREDPELEAVRGILEYNSFSFSPHGDMLAFMAAVEGPTSDLYLYAFDSFETTRLTDGPSQAYQPVWSPDGKYIVHTGVSAFGTGAGASMMGVWAVRIDDHEVLTLYDPSGSGSESIIGWLDNRTFVVYSWDAGCGSKDLRSFNIETLEVKLLWAASFRAAAFDPSSAVVLLTSNEGDCSPAGGAGIYRVPTDGAAPVRILEESGPRVIWSQAAQLFLVSGDFGSWFIAVDTHGQFIDLDKPPEANDFPAVNPGTRDLAWPGKSLWIGPLLGSIENPPQEIFSEPVHTVTWTPDGGAILFFTDSGFYIAHKPDFTPLLIAEGLDNRQGYSGWLSP